MVIALFYLNIGAYAGVSFRTTQKVCSQDEERLEFYRDGTCVIRTNSHRFEGTYSLENHNKEIVIKSEGQKFRGTITWHNNTTQDRIIQIEFEGTKYKPGLCK